MFGTVRLALLCQSMQKVIKTFILPYFIISDIFELVVEKPTSRNDINGSFNTTHKGICFYITISQR